MRLGIDLGGTKCGVVLGDERGIYLAEKFPTGHARNPEDILNELAALAGKLLKGEKPESVGISCGGPLDSKKGLILSPPNLPGWDAVPVTDFFERKFGCKAHLENDANASALAEWQYGAGRGSRNMVFLTFGTGLGAGLILDGRLYSGTNDMAGEAGHITLSPFGPTGYGKVGSFEGFCSGGGIAQLGYTLALEEVQAGRYPAFFPKGAKAEDITAKSVAMAAEAGDVCAERVYETSGYYLGKGLSILIDLLNPELIVIGSVFARSGHLMRESMEKAIRENALERSREVCKVVPAELGDNIGDYAALAASLLA